MLQTSTLNFRLILAKKSPDITGCRGNYYIELTGENPFNLDKTFSEKFIGNAAGVPFYNLEDVIRFSEDMASFWELRLLANPMLAITSIEELADIWRKFAADLYASDAVIPQLSVSML